ncbi:MAG TPA: DCC1-like thiol-disulfide oxidoreductase family protein [Kiritimatiellia bacterium]|nr:DCC1-like thiol-disulfide oxidoreductase family protein [Kiritimatiellia bacterium]HMP35580.1 DCC1-like thiol-disulfide oxidoreductase family protein [Kiritimatiellia bacterium]
MEHPVILFDGVCNLCHGAVRFIIRRDRAARFRFASLQSEPGRRLAAGPAPDSILLIENGLRYDRSTAALRIARRLDGAWPLLYAFIVIPRPLRDVLYAWIARHRYRWFGRLDACPLPSPEWETRFL